MCLNKYGVIAIMWLAVVLTSSCNNANKKDWPKSFGFGRTASPQEIAALDIDIRPDGKGLPAGNGVASRGQVVFAAKCALCHGEGGRAVKGGKLPAPALSSDTTFKNRKGNTIGNYWPYATTLFDYIRRSMPYNAPGTLSNQEVYDLTAYLLYTNSIKGYNDNINAQTLPRVVMPAKKYFVTDNRKGGKEIR
jgi:mono/diheme cytochrome c family protein